MNRRSMVTRVLMIDGILLLVVAAIHFYASGPLTRWLSSRLSPQQFVEVGPPFLLNHVVVGILLVPVALTTFYSAWGVKKGQHWSRVVSMINGFSVLSLPFVIGWLMGAEYFSSVLFLLATVLVVIIGITMLVPVVWFPKDPVEITPHADPSKNLLA